MQRRREGITYENLKKEGTGNHKMPEELEEYKEIIYPFDKYEIKVKLSLTNGFIGIVEVKVNKDFLSHKQKITSKGFHDVEEFYRE